MYTDVAGRPRRRGGRRWPGWRGSGVCAGAVGVVFAADSVGDLVEQFVRAVAQVEVL